MIKKIYTIFLITTMIFVSACGNTLGEGEVYLYCTNDNSQALIEYIYKPSASSTEDLAREFFDEMKSVSSADGYSIIPEGAKCENIILEGEILNIYLSGSISQLSSAKKLVLAAGITKAMLQIEGVMGVKIIVGDEVLLDGDDNSFGILSGNSFVVNANEGGADVRESNVTLYFADEDEDNLVKVQEQVSYRSTTPIERVVVEKIIEGPSSDDVNPTVSDKLEVLNISVRDGVCYLDLSEDFITSSVALFDNVAIYSIVNSLTDLDGINSVQITINGKTDRKMPKGNTSLEEAFSYNAEIVNK